MANEIKSIKIGSTEYPIYPDNALNADQLKYTDFSFTDGISVADYAANVVSKYNAGKFFSTSGWAWANSSTINVGSYSLDRMRFSAMNIRQGDLNSAWQQQAILFLPTYKDQKSMYIAQMYTTEKGLNSGGKVDTNVIRFPSESEIKDIKVDNAGYADSAGSANSAGYADSAGSANSVAWSNVSSRPGNFTGATSSAVGSAGFVPAPSKGQQSCLLQGNGSWISPYWWNADNVHISSGSSSIDLNNRSGGSTFVCTSWDYAGSSNNLISNSPWSSSSAATVTGFPGSYPWQLCRFYSTNDLYIRGYYSGTGWTNWQKIALSGESQPASDVYAWAKASSKPSYKTSEVAEETNLYFTNKRAIDACSGTYLTGITKAMVTNALGYTPPTTDTNTWRGITDTYNVDEPSSSISLSQKGAKALYDSVKYRQYYSINLESLSTSYFYPIYFAASDYETDCEIHSPNVGGEKPWNQNHIHFLLTAQGWSDTARRFIILSQGVYSDTEITIGAIGYGNRQGAQCIWLRGGLTYRMICNKTPIWNGSNITYGDEVYTVGTNYDGGTNSYVTVVWQYGDNATNVATVGHIPTKTSQLTNDSNYTTATGHTHDYLPLAGGAMSSGARISASGGNLVLGNSNNAGWVQVQDMCSQSGSDKWKITQAGSATFVSTVSAAGGFYESSDERLKDIQAPLTTDLDKLSHLRKVYFNFKEDPSKTHIGVIAQDIKELYPEIVTETDEGILNVDYSKLSVIALDAVDQLNDKCNNLETELQEVKEKLNKVLNALNL